MNIMKGVGQLSLVLVSVLFQLSACDADSNDRAAAVVNVLYPNETLARSDHLAARHGHRHRHGAAHRRHRKLNHLTRKALERMSGDAEDGLQPFPRPLPSSHKDVHLMQRNAKKKKQRTEQPPPPPAGRGHARKAKSPPPKRPNIIFILTDDQDIELGSMDYMPKARRILGEGGVHIKNAYVTTPMCCPSRSSILTGLYVHNHNVYTNGENCSSPTWQQTHERRTFATYLQSSGYRTAFFGKYLNEYNGSYIPPGWTDWSALVRNSRYYNYTLNVNGERMRHGADYHLDYYPDRILNDSLQYMRFAKTFFAHRPYLMVLSHPAPHGPEDSAPQYQDMFGGQREHRTKSWNHAPNGDKQWLLRQTPKMTDTQQEFTDFLYTKRLQTLQSVDELVERVYEELKRQGEVDNTYIVYTSDHGYHLGQFGLVKGKAMPFEFDVKVPFYITGPNLPKNTTLSSIVLNIDIAPTMLDLAGLEIPPHMDGASFLPYLKQLNQSGQSSEQAKPSRNSFLIERGKFKVKNSIDRLLMPIIGKKQWLHLECQKPEYQSPCVEGQKFECFRDRNGNDRIRKCRLAPSHGCVCPPHMKVKKNFALLANDNDVLATRTKFHQHRIRASRSHKYSHRRRDRRSKDEHHPLTMFITDESTSSAEQQQQQQQSATSFDIDAVYQLRKLIDLARAPNGGKNSVDNKTIGNVGANVADQPALITTSQLVSILENFGDINVAGMDYLLDDQTFCNVTRSNLTIACSEVTNSWQTKKEHINKAIKLLERRLAELKGVRRMININNKHQQHFNKKQGGGGRQFNRNKFSQVCHCVPQEEEEDFEDENYDHPPLPPRSVHRRYHKHGDRKTRKGRRKAKFQNTTCEVAVSEQQMNCFTHDNHHWKTPPLWTNGPFCFCQNALNNSFWCLRTINETSNYLYCEFVTGFITFYNITKDPYQLRNAIFDLEFNQIEEMSRELAHLKDCAGHEQCSLSSPSSSSRVHPTTTTTTTTTTNTNTSTFSRHSRRRSSLSSRRPP